jgi:hypothetical protein
MELLHDFVEGGIIGKALGHLEKPMGNSVTSPSPWKKIP